ncbi:MAG: type IV-A pilus assembly ATPase PilB, partial [Gammaproteobacteria bacterium]|nr:type IV-A pilus assembly ATPase PilB [Gammaproteobacteria bacterium]
MAVTNPKIHLGGLARKLVMDGLLSEEDALTANDEAQKGKIAFISHVVSKKLVSGRDVAYAASQEFGVPMVDIDAMEIDHDVVKLVDEKLVTKHHALPIYKRGNRLYI